MQSVSLFWLSIEGPTAKPRPHFPVSATTQVTVRNQIHRTFVNLSFWDQLVGRVKLRGRVKASVHTRSSAFGWMEPGSNVFSQLELRASPLRTALDFRVAAAPSGSPLILTFLNLLGKERKVVFPTFTSTHPVTSSSELVRTAAQAVAPSSSSTLWIPFPGAQ